MCVCVCVCVCSISWAFYTVKQKWNPLNTKNVCIDKKKVDLSFLDMK